MGRALNAGLFNGHTLMATSPWRCLDVLEAGVPSVSFVLIVADHAMRFFWVEGSIEYDNPCTSPVFAAQDGGKRLIIGFVPGGPSRTGFDTAAREYQHGD